MSIMLNLSLCIGLLFCLGLTGSAAAATPIPTGSTLNKTSLQLVGKAQFSVLFWDIYASRLYTPSGQYNGVNPSVLFEITYQTDIDKKDLIRRTVEQWQHLGLNEAEYGQFLPKLNALWPDIVEGDKLALFVGANGSAFYLNDKSIGLIEDHRFAAMFLDIWLSPKTSQPALRLQLLGGHQ
jgi:hypothetical protein